MTNDPILVVLDVLPDGTLAKSAAGLLGAAAGVGTPVAVVATASGRGAAAAEAAASLGASRVLVAESEDTDSALTVPRVDAATAAVAAVTPGAILISNSIEGRDVAGRLAAR